MFFIGSSWPENKTSNTDKIEIVYTVEEFLVGKVFGLEWLRGVAEVDVVE